MIRQWAARHQAVPATGEATSSGPATPMKVTDGGAGLRFNFPGFARFLEIDASSSVPGMSLKQGASSDDAFETVSSGRPDVSLDNIIAAKLGATDAASKS